MFQCASCELQRTELIKQFCKNQLDTPIKIWTSLSHVRLTDRVKVNRLYHRYSKYLPHDQKQITEPFYQFTSRAFRTELYLSIARLKFTRLKKSYVDYLIPSLARNNALRSNAFRPELKIHVFGFAQRNGDI